MALIAIHIDSLLLFSGIAQVCGSNLPRGLVLRYITGHRGLFDKLLLKLLIE
jgi:hypothetical protein